MSKLRKPSESVCFLPAGRLTFPLSPRRYSLCNRCPRAAPVAALEDFSDVSSIAPIATPSQCPAHQQEVPPSESPTRRVNAHLPAGVNTVNYRSYPDGFPNIDSPPPPPPVHPTVPMVGFLFDFLLGIYPRDRARKSGDIYTGDGLSQRMHYVTDWNAINELCADSSTFINKDSSPIFIALFGEDTSLNLDGDEHKTFRRKLGSAFSGKLFPFYLERIRMRAEDAWREMSHQTVKEGKPGLLADMIRELYLAVTIDFSNGIGLNPEEYSKLRELYAVLLTGFPTPSFMPSFKKAFVARDEILVIIERVVRRMLIEDADIITELRKYGDNISAKAGKDILKGRVSIAHIWSAASPVNVGPNAENDPEVIREIARVSLLLWFAGMATSAATTSCALMEMGFDQNIWDRLYAEQEVMVKKAGGDREVKYEQIGDMKLLDSFLDEMLRMFPAAIGASRIVAHDCEAFGKRIEKGSRLFFDFYAANRDERYYENPDTVIIDRFLNGAPPVLTFGAKRSAHYCLGAGLSKVLMKTTLSILLREYTMEMDQNQSRKKKAIPVIDNTPRSKVKITALRPRD